MCYNVIIIFYFLVNLLVLRQETKMNASPIMFFAKFFLCFQVLFTSYQLALAYIGVSLPLKQILLPSLVFSIIAFVSKSWLEAPALIHTVVIAITGAGLLCLFNKINILLSSIGSLMSTITLTLGSFLFACPILAKLGYIIPQKNFNGIDWLLLNILEIVIPFIILIILKIAKFSLMKYIPISK
jgi:hypothetical protein